MAAWSPSEEPPPRTSRTCSRKAMGGGAVPDTEVFGDVFLAQAAPC